MSQRDTPHRFRVEVGWVTVRELAATVVAVSVAVAVIPQFWIGGRFLEQIGLVGGIAAVVTVVHVLMLPVHRRLSRVLRRVFRWTVTSDPDDDFADRELLVWFLVMSLSLFSLVLLNFAIFSTVTYAALWLAVRLGHACGLPVQLHGFWPTALAALVIGAGIGVGSAILALATGDRRVLRVARFLAEYGLVVGGLWLAVATLDGVHLDTGTGLTQSLTLIVLGCWFASTDFYITAPFLTTIFRITISALKLWLISWMSTGMQTPLHITGFSSFVWTAVIITIATVPERLIDSALRPPSPPTRSRTIRSHITSHSIRCTDEANGSVR